MFGYYRLAAHSPALRVADVDYNVAQLIGAFEQCVRQQVAAVVFPELCITGYSCGDLFFQPHLLQAAWRGLQNFTRATQGTNTVAVLGLPLLHEDALYNVAVVVQAGKIVALVPKTILPNYREFYEKRQFRSGADLGDTLHTVQDAVPFGRHIVFRTQDAAPFTFGVELCEDLWSVIPPGSILSLNGARAIFNPSAGTELTGKADYRIELVKQQSGRCLGAYVLSAAGVLESTTDAVFGGHCLIAENGRLAAQSDRLTLQAHHLVADIDFDKLTAARLSESSFNDAKCLLPVGTQTHSITLPAPVPESPDLAFARIPARPFLPAPDQAEERCGEILAIQSAGLAKRLLHTQAKRLVIGVSGGLDSTLALLVAVQACDMCHLPHSAILAVTMPGFGTTGRTNTNAKDLCAALGVELREIPISKACLQHFQDIGHNPAQHTTTYENVQARERTQILMDLANKLGGLVVGTGDLSEIALGWSTYNGDHMSMYAVNCSIPKTLIRALINHIAQQSPAPLAATLTDIINTPVSPELLPPAENGAIEQKTESLLGPYDLHDFFLYHMIKYGAPPAKLLYLANHTFQEEYPPDLIRQCLNTFLHRFFTQQFKRSCMPDGPKVGTVSLSPRGDWRMPSDACGTLWSADL